MDKAMETKERCEFSTVDGKWFLFVDGKAIRPLADEEAAWVIWGKKPGICMECGLLKPSDERVKNGMKCSTCAGYGGG